MIEIKCQVCGESYSIDLKVCPHCLGLGSPDINCSCNLYRNFRRKPIRIIKIRNPECPVHGNNKGNHNGSKPL